VTLREVEAASVIDTEFVVVEPKVTEVPPFTVAVTVLPPLEVTVIAILV
jgi:hypothetical protein